jgi:hypothetical protein
MGGGGRVVLLIALLAATVLLSGLVLVAGFRRRSHEPLEFPTVDASRGAPVGASPAAGNWMFDGAGGLG